MKLRNFFSKLRSLKYVVKCYFFPYNVVKAEYLTSTWNDRDELMFHSIFQILVDFVELEQPFVLWRDKHNKRFTDRSLMNAYIEKWFNSNDCTLEEQNQNKKHLYINREIMYLYEWYKDEKFEFDMLKYYDATGEKLIINRESHQVETVKTGLPKLITWNELHEIEQEHKIRCNIMLRRVLNVREYLWT